jgi:hypothetical protein
MSTELLEGRIAELEEFRRRIRPATDGQDGWVNFIESRVLEERQFALDVVAHALAHMQREILDACKVLITEALAQRIRGTFDPKAKYGLGDVAALDGASFIARRDNPGPCPGSGWQLLARQGGRGIAGPEGKRGPPGAVIAGWILDRSNFRVTPRMSDGTLGPPLELRALFAPSEDNTA